MSVTPGPSVRVPENRCPSCSYKYKLDGAMCIGEEASPEPGDVTICLGCAEILEFTAGLGVKVSSYRDARLIRLQDAVRQFHREHGRPGAQ